MNNQNAQQQVQILPRGCGYPIRGSCYISVPTGLNGHMIWEFALCPTIPIADLNSFGLAKNAMVLKERQGKRGIVYDIWDWIGSSGYPKPTDWFMEVMKLGFHQKCVPDQLLKLTEESFYFAVHADASFVDPNTNYDTRHSKEHPQYPVCPAGHKAHIELPPEYSRMDTCFGLLFDDLIGDPNNMVDSPVTVTMPAFTYPGYSPIDFDQEHVPAAFFRMPIGKMAKILVYRDEETLKHEDVLKVLEELDVSMQRVEIVSLGDPIEETK